MKTLVQRLISIGFFSSLCGNNVLAVANPLIGEIVVRVGEYEFPFVVSVCTVPADSVADHFCTGTLISKAYVLTAAHCFETRGDEKEHMIPSNVLVTVGSNDLTQGLKHRIKGWTTFNQWAEEKKINVKCCVELYHDIAMITLLDAVEYVKPAHVSNLKYKHIYKKKVVVVGWGITNNDVKPRYLRKATLRVLTKRQCLNNLDATGIDSSIVLNHLCTTSMPQISLGCGDSGGPLLIDDSQIVGINEADCTNIGNPYHQSIHGSIRFYRKFIANFVALDNSTDSEEIDTNCKSFMPECCPPDVYGH